jgi:2-keto-4-pentenoate hydratase/2-oxohepta-3-ene-1,7-dioic acid hydratase in catechol pathway
MKLATISTTHGTTTAVVEGDEIVDLSLAGPELPIEMSALLAGGSEALEHVRAAVASGRGRSPLAEARLAAPVPRPSKFLAVGLNYADHVAENGGEIPDFPTVFAKLSSCVAGPHDDVERPVVSPALDYEGELAFVIGRRCRHVPRERANEVIAGYMVANDVSVRDWQIKTPQWTLGKSFDTHGVLGPWIVTPDEVDPNAGLELTTHVNGTLRQHSSTSNLIFDCAALVEILSKACTLEPGDVIATGTPSGVGAFMEPRTWLVPGDVVRVEIEGVGAIENRVVAEPEPHEWTTGRTAAVSA